MKKIKKLLKKLNNSGSSLVMVVVSLAFLGIIVGALLTATLYSLKLKSRDLNSKDNFYYLEQAMSEIYAGVGSDTATLMQDAYFETLEEMVYYDTSYGNGGYKVLTKEEANKKFREKFMDSSNTFLTGKDLKEYLKGFISDKTVTLDVSKLYLDASGLSTDKKLVIKNVVLNRTVKYDNTAKGEFTQTISTDIVISEPDFIVSFASSFENYSNIYDYALVADMGVEINKATSTQIVGNIYAASDFYNKLYDEDGFKIETEDSEDYKYNGEYINKYTHANHYRVTNRETGDGISDSSIYSGIYLSNDADLTIMANNIVVPGSISVTDGSKLFVYGKGGTSVSTAEIWADSIVLDGSSDSSATFFANLFISDDTELNSEASTLTIASGSGYYGYNNSTNPDNRHYAPTVSGTTLSNLYTDTEHFNSSSIILNGKSTTLDIANAETLFLAGRTYIDLTKMHRNDNDYYVNHALQNNTITDYKTGESLSVKSNQLAYIPVSTVNTETIVGITVNGNNVEFRGIKLSKSGDLYSLFFPRSVFNGYAPALIRTTGYVSDDGNGNTDALSKNTYFYDLKTTFDILKDAYSSMTDKAAYDELIKARYGASASFDDVFGSSDEFAARFIEAFSVEEGLPDVSLAMGVISGDTTTAYASGGITTGQNGNYSITTYANNDLCEALLSDATSNNGVISYDANKQSALSFLNNSEVSSVLSLSSALAREYEYMKWNLGHYKTSDVQLDGDTTKFVEEQYIDDLINNEGYGNITPINKYVNLDEMPSSTIVKDISTYKAVVAKGDYTINFTRGVVFATGDIHFADSVTSFEGLIIAGGKIYIGSSSTLNMIKSSPEVCKAIMKNLRIENSEDAQKILKVFNAYTDSESGSDGGDGGQPDVTVDMITYTDVVEYSNWMRNVE